MPIHSRTGNIFDEAPQVAQASVLWLSNRLRSGRDWKDARDKRNWEPRPDDCPWEEEEDRLIELDPPDGTLTWFYVFSNPRNASGLEGVAAVGEAVERALSALVDQGVNSMAMLLIPVCPQRNETPAQEADAPSARRNELDSHQFNPDDALPDKDKFSDVSKEKADAMIEAIHDWEQQHLEIPIDVHLVDIQGDFDGHIQRWINNDMNP